MVISGNEILSTPYTIKLLTLKLFALFVNFLNETMLKYKQSRFPQVFHNILGWFKIFGGFRFVAYSSKFSAKLQTIINQIYQSQFFLQMIKKLEKKRNWKEWKVTKNNESFSENCLLNYTESKGLKIKKNVKTCKTL